MVINLEKKLDDGWSIILKKNKENYVIKHFESEKKMRNFFKNNNQYSLYISTFSIVENKYSIELPLKKYLEIKNK